MTFTEAAIEVLRREGKPLHFKKIAEIAVRESLLDHVGKVPEETMADQLAAHCRLPKTERRVMPVLPGTFALSEWGLEEDPAGLDALIEPPPEEGLAYRSRERHPIPSREVARGSARADGRGRRRDEEERRGRRFPPPAEVAYEMLAGAGRPLSLVEIAAQGAERSLMPDAFVRDTGSLQAALHEDNRRREAAGRKSLFLIEAEAVTLVAQPEPGERIAAPAVARPPTTLAEIRRAALASLRRRLRELDGPTVEHVVCALLEKLGFREVKVAKRGREHVVYTARRKMGVAEVRHGIRILRGGADAGRRDVVDLRRDLGHYGAQIGIVVTAGEAAREARGESGAGGQLPVVLLCGEALAESFAEAGVGCVPVVVPEVDEAFFRAAAEAGEREEAARRARREERERRERREPPRGEEAPERAPGEREEAPTVAVEVSGASGGEDATTAGTPSIVVGAGEADEGEEEGAEAEGASPEGAAEGTGETGADRRRRRRRRRRRGGRGRGREGPSPAGDQVTPGVGPTEAEAGASGATPPTGDGGSGEAGPPTPGTEGGEPAA